MLITQELEKTLKKAFDEAKSRRHEYVTLEHLLYALTYDAVASQILCHCGADLRKLRDEIELFFRSNLPSFKDEKHTDPQYTLGFQFVLQVAASHMQSAGKNQMDGGNVLIALFREKESHAVYFLSKQNVSRFDVVRYISHGVSTEENESDLGGLDESETEEKKARPKNPLLRFCVNLNEKALAGKIDPMIGREKELERTIHILARRRKNNPIFVGDAGVGKTAIVEGLSLRIIEKKVPACLLSTTVYSLDMGALLAGTKFRGEFEERLKSVIQTLSKKPDHVLFIDEIHTIIGAGAVSGGTLDASNLLKPALTSGEIKCIGTTTYKEYRTIFEKDHALSRRFQKVEVGEPSEEESFLILKGLKKHYEDFHQVTYMTSALKAAVTLSSKYLTDRYLPDKAIDVMDEAGAEVKLKNPQKMDARVSPKDIEKMISRIAKVPTHTVKAEDKERLKTLSQDLKLLIFGQDAAIDQVVQAIQLSRAGLGEPDKTIGSFLFSGPTGVGKTEVSKQLALALGIEFIRFDMSEYMEKHTVSRLIGSPPGYVGFEQGGLLTEAIHRNPHAVLLLDEIEKAHEDLFNILLQVMDHATLTDNNGRKSDFRQVILIMTTNTGARDSMVRSIGFEKKEFEDKSQKAIEKTFSPEFRNRLTSTIHFQPLSLPIAEQIVDKMMSQLEQRLRSKNILLSLDAEARAYLAQKGFDSQYGARPIRRLIEKEVSHPLSSEILFGKLVKGGRVKIGLVDGKLEFRVDPELAEISQESD